MTYPTQLSAIADQYDALLCDVWGVMHNGVELYDGVLDAFKAFKAKGGHIVLITNAPRPSAPVIEALKVLGADRNTYDDIVTSGDATIELIKRQQGQKVHHIGPQKDLPLFEALDIEFTDIDTADMIVCTDLYPEHGQNIDIYDELLTPARDKQLPLICANPDLIIDHGGQKIYCAGIVAEAYEKLGGEVHMVGKPFGPIYDIARDKVAACKGQAIDQSRVLAIGDSVKTDLAGAHGAGLDIYFVKGGILALEEQSEALEAQFQASIAPFQSAIKALAPRLVW